MDLFTTTNPQSLDLMTHQPQSFHVIPPHIKECNTLLANLFVYQQKLLHFRWAMRLKPVASLLEVLNKLHYPHLLQLDALANEILNQGIRPLSTLQQYSTHAEIKEGRNFFDSKVVLNQLWKDQHTLLNNLHRALRLSAGNATDSCQNLLRHFLKLLYQDMDIVREQNMGSL